MINSYLDDQFYGSFTEELIISLKKVRNIGLKSFSLSGRVVSLKRNDLVSFESSLERDFIHCLEFDKSVIAYYEQPLKIFYEVNNSKRYYVPDFYVQYLGDRRDEIIEIKYKYDLQKNKRKYRDKFEAARQFCKANNLKFIVKDETDVRTPYMFNSKFLLPYMISKQDIDFTDVHVLENSLKTLGESTPEELILKSNCNDERKAELIYVLWFMLANDDIKVNLNEKLTMQSKIWI